MTHLWGSKLFFNEHDKCSYSVAVVLTFVLKFKSARNKKRGYQMAYLHYYPMSSVVVAIQLQFSTSRFNLIATASWTFYQLLCIYQVTFKSFYLWYISGEKGKKEKYFLYLAKKKKKETFFLCQYPWQKAFNSVDGSFSPMMTSLLLSNWGKTSVSGLAKKIGMFHFQFSWLQF